MKKQLLTLTLAALTTFQVVAQSKKTQKAATFPNNQQSKTQVAPPSNVYSFSTFTAPYQPINGTSLTNGLKWDDPNHSIPLGFNFNFYSTSGSTISLWGGSSISFGDFDNDMIITEGGPMWEDLCDRSYDPNVDSEGDPGGTSTISYTTTGVAGSRICKIEMANVGFYGENDANGVSTSFANFQIWLYETSNDIEFRYGNVNVPNKAECFASGTSGFYCGLIDSLDYGTFVFGRSNVLDGVHSNPSMVAMDANFTKVVSGDIADGRVYKFTRSTPTGLQQLSGSKNISVYPNPAKETIYLRGEIPVDSKIAIFDIAGKKVFEREGSSSVSIASLEKGIYLVKIKSKDSELYSAKLVVSE